jgi:uncharacterized protein YndB with AHSA1/START domain
VRPEGPLGPSPPSREAATARELRARVTLPGDVQILITREFAAPRDRFHTTPELVAPWWHGGRGTIDSIEIDLRVGGGVAMP